MCARLVFLAWLSLSVVLVLVGWVLPASWSLAPFLRASLLPVFPGGCLVVLALSVPWLSVCCFLVLDAYGGIPWGYMS